MIRLRIFALILLSFTALSACGGGQTRTEGQFKDRPTWVDQGGRAFKDKAFYGVGAASQITSTSLRRSTADAQARAELARLFSERVQANLQAAEGADPEQRAEAIKVFAEMELAGVDIAHRFFDTENSVQYSIARLDSEAFKAHLERTEYLSSTARDIILKAANQAFDAISKTR